MEHDRSAGVILWSDIYIYIYKTFNKKIRKKGKLRKNTTNTITHPQICLRDRRIVEPKTYITSLKSCFLW